MDIVKFEIFFETILRKKYCHVTCEERRRHSISLCNHIHAGTYIILLCHFRNDIYGTLFFKSTYAKIRCFKIDLNIYTNIYIFSDSRGHRKCGNLLDTIEFEFFFETILRKKYCHVTCEERRRHSMSLCKHINAGTYIIFLCHFRNDIYGALFLKSTYPKIRCFKIDLKLGKTLPYIYKYIQFSRFKGS